MSARMCVLQRDNDQLAELVGRLTCTLQVCTTPCMCCIKHVHLGVGMGGGRGIQVGLQDHTRWSRQQKLSWWLKLAHRCH
jgi:hypothetical protein